MNTNPNDRRLHKGGMRLLATHALGILASLGVSHAQVAGSAKLAVELANGKNGVPLGTFIDDAGGGYYTSPIGDVDGNGVPDILCSAGEEVNFGGGAVVVLMNEDGTALNAVHLANGKNGIPPNSFAATDRVGYNGVGIGDIDGDNTPDIALSARGNDDGGTDSGGAWIILLWPDGQAKSAIELANGKNEIPLGSFGAGDQVGVGIWPMGDINGDLIPDLLLSASHSDEENGHANSGGGWIILLDSNGTAKSAVELTNGKNNIPALTFGPNHLVGYKLSSMGDLDGNGVNDVVFRARDNGAGGGAWIILLNANGTATNVVELVNGKNNIPAGQFVGAGYKPASIGDVNRDGIPDLVLGDERLGGAHVILMNTNGAAKAAIRLANNENGIPPGTFNPADNIGRWITATGDIDGNNVPDFATGCYTADDGGADSGGAFVVLLQSNGTAKAAIRLANNSNGVPPGSFMPDDLAGKALSSPGDIDSDGVMDLVLGASDNDDGANNSGAAWVMLMNSEPTVASSVKLANGLNGVPPAKFPAGSKVGFRVTALGDLDSDGIPDAALSGIGSATGGGAWITLLNSNGTIKSLVELTNGKNGVPAGAFDATSEAGSYLVNMGDVDGDSIHDLLISHHLNNSGAWLIFLNSNGTAKSLIDLKSGVNGIPANSFGHAGYSSVMTWLGDVDGNGVPDFAIGSALRSGASVVLLNANGTALNVIRLENGLNGVPAGTFLTADRTRHMDALGDLDGDNVPDLVLGVPTINTGFANSGGAFVILLNSNGTAKSVVKLANNLNGVPPNSFAAADWVGYDVATLGDLDGDGIRDIALSAFRSDEGGATDSGGAWTILLNANGTAKSVTELTNGKNGIPTKAFKAQDSAGFSVTALDDVDGDGIPDLGIGNPANDDGAANAGGIWVVYLDAAGKAKRVREIANNRGGVPSGSFQAEDRIGNFIYSIGDLDGNGVPDLMSGSPNTDAGGTDSGGAWIFLMD